MSENVGAEELHVSKFFFAGLVDLRIQAEKLHGHLRAQYLLRLS